MVGMFIQNIPPLPQSAIRHAARIIIVIIIKKSACFLLCLIGRPMNWNPSTIDGPKAVGIIDYRIIETESRKRVCFDCF